VSFREDAVLDEVDLMVIDALQLNPRASWAQLGEVLDVAPITVARRWQRLADSGRAWVNVGIGTEPPSPVVLAVIELSCRPGTAADIGRSLAQLPQVLTVEQTTGEFDTILVVATPSLTTLSEFLFDRLSQHSGINHMRSHVCTRLFGGTTWRLGVLNATQTQSMLAGQRRSGLAREHRAFGVEDRDLLRALGADGRAGVTELSVALGTSTQTVARRLTALRSSGQLVFRCDLARPLAGWHGLVLLRIEVPDEDLDHAGRVLGAWRENRLCVAVASTPNLFAMFGLRATGDVTSLTGRLRKELPQARLVERCLILRQIKVYGKLLDDDGCATATVPVDPWAK
jgi:DNA-binding Lrp family transcriptional regulator